VLNASDTDLVLDYQAAVKAVDDSFRELGAKRVVMPPRSTMEVATVAYEKALEEGIGREI